MNSKLQKIVEIDGEKYLIQHNTPTKAWKISIKLTKIIAEPFSAMAQGGSDEEKAAEVLPKAVKALMENLDGESSLALLRDVFETVEYHGEREKILLNSEKAFNSHFMGKMGLMLKVFAAAVEFQFGDFITAIGDGVADLMKKEPKAKTA